MTGNSLYMFFNTRPNITNCSLIHVYSNKYYLSNPIIYVRTNDDYLNIQFQFGPEQTESSSKEPPATVTREGGLLSNGHLSKVGTLLLPVKSLWL